MLTVAAPNREATFAAQSPLARALQAQQWLVQSWLTSSSAGQACGHERPLDS